MKKAIMAVTGILLVGFILGHMAGNLKLSNTMADVQGPMGTIYDFGEYGLYGGALAASAVSALVASHVVESGTAVAVPALLCLTGMALL